MLVNRLFVHCLGLALCLFVALLYPNAQCLVTVRAHRLYVLFLFLHLQFLLSKETLHKARLTALHAICVQALCGVALRTCSEFLVLL